MSSSLLGSRVEALGSRMQDLGSKGLGFRVSIRRLPIDRENPGVEFGLQGLGFRVL